MKETERSLRAYFGLAGAIALLLAWRDWSSIRDFVHVLPFKYSVAFFVPMTSRIVIGVGFLAACARLPDALLTGATWIKKLLVFSGVMMPTLPLAIRASTSAIHFVAIAFVGCFVATAFQVPPWSRYLPHHFGLPFVPRL